MLPKGEGPVLLGNAEVPLLLLAAPAIRHSPTIVPAVAPLLLLLGEVLEDANVLGAVLPKAGAGLVVAEAVDAVYVACIPLYAMHRKKSGGVGHGLRILILMCTSSMALLR